MLLAVGWCSYHICRYFLLYFSVDFQWNFFAVDDQILQHRHVTQNLFSLGVRSKLNPNSQLFEIWYQCPSEEVDIMPASNQCCLLL